MKPAQWLWLWLAAGALVALGAFVSPLSAQMPGKGARSHPTAEEVSRQWLTRHPRPRDDAGA